MKTGVFIYRSYTGELRRVHVRECPDPAAARRMLEEHVVGSGVAWQEAPRARP